MGTREAAGRAWQPEEQDGWGLQPCLGLTCVFNLWPLSCPAKDWLISSTKQCLRLKSVQINIFFINR